MAERFRFTKDYDYKPNSQSTVAYKAGYEGLIPAGAVEAAKKAGVGHVVEKEAAAKAEKPKN